MESIDAEYRALRERNYAGWGGSSFRARLKGWGREIDSLRRNSLIPGAPASVLELGCGNGAVSTLLARRGYRVSGVDIAPSAIDWARDEFRRRRLDGDFFVGDVTSVLTQLAGSSFDVVVDGNCLHCILDSAARQHVLAGTHRLLRAGGRLLVSSMCGDPAALDEGDSFDRERRLLIRNGAPHRYLATRDTLVAEVAAAGFEISWSRVQSNPWWSHLWLVATARG